jgi:hypothetical protein
MCEEDGRRLLLFFTVRSAPLPVLPLRTVVGDQQ